MLTAAHDIAAVTMPAVDCDDAGVAPIASPGSIVVVLWEPAWADRIAALRQRSGDRLQLGPWTVTAPLDGGLLVESFLVEGGRTDFGPRNATTKVLQLITSLARRLAA